MNQPLVKLLRTNRLAYKTIGNETIILDTKIGKEVHQLNEVASFVWNLCDGKHDLLDIINSVCDEFEIDSQTATGDVENLVNELKTKSLLVESTN